MSVTFGHTTPPRISPKFGALLQHADRTIPRESIVTLEKALVENRDSDNVDVLATHSITPASNTVELYISDRNYQLNRILGQHKLANNNKKSIPAQWAHITLPTECLGNQNYLQFIVEICKQVAKGAPLYTNDLLRPDGKTGSLVPGVKDSPNHTYILSKPAQ